MNGGRGVRRKGKNVPSFANRLPPLEATDTGFGEEDLSGGEGSGDGSSSQCSSRVKPR